AEEDSLAENVQRAPLHPLDQFRAFLALREKGISEEEIAAAFFVSVQVVKQRLKLASVSPKLLDVYAEDGMTLDQLMAFTVSLDHERQEQMWEALQRSYTKEPYYIRRLLTEGAVRASDKRAASSSSTATRPSPALRSTLRASRSAPRRPVSTTPALRRLSTTGTAVGPNNCHGSRAISGTCCLHSILTAARPCSRIASRLASMRCT